MPWIQQNIRHSLCWEIWYWLSRVLVSYSAFALFLFYFFSVSLCCIFSQTNSLKVKQSLRTFFKWHFPQVFFMVLMKVWKQKCGPPLSFSQKLLLLQAVNVLTQHFSTGGSWPKNESQICSHRVVDSSGETIINVNNKKQITVQN